MFFYPPHPNASPPHSFLLRERGCFARSAIFHPPLLNACMDTKIHIGNLIYSKLKEEGRAASWLAQKLHCDRTNVYKIFRKSNIDMALLLHISTVLDFDFFACYSELLRKGKPATAAADNDDDNEVNISWIIGE